MPTAGPKFHLLTFPAFDSHGDWVWLPPLSWSPESRYLATLVHEKSPDGKAEDSPHFGLWVLDVQSHTELRLVERVGMWADPVWSSPWRDGYGLQHVELAYGVAQFATYSQYSPYQLWIMDRDGSNKLRLLPSTNQSGLSHLDLAWAPAERKLVCVHQGDLYLIELEPLRYWPLTRGLMVGMTSKSMTNSATTGSLSKTLLAQTISSLL